MASCPGEGGGVSNCRKDIPFMKGAGASVLFRFKSEWRRSWSNPFVFRIFSFVLGLSLFLSVFVPVAVCYYIDIDQFKNPWGIIDYIEMYAPGADFRPIYQASAALGEGDSVYVMTPNVPAEKLDPNRILSSGFSNYSYSPPLAYLLYPMSLLPFKASYTLLCFLTLAWCVLGIYFASRCFPWPWAVFFTGIVLYAQSLFLRFELERGQTDALLLLLISFGIYLFHIKRQSILPGAIFSLAALIKVTPAIFVVVFILRKDKLAIVSFVLSAVAIVLLTDVNDWYYWVTEVAPFWSRVRVGWGMDHSFNYLATWFLPENADFSKVAFLSLAILTLLFMWLAIVNPEYRRCHLLEFSIVSILMNVATPWSSNYKLILLIFAYLMPFVVIMLNLPVGVVFFVFISYFASFLLLFPVSTVFIVRLFTVVLPLYFKGEILSNVQLYEVFSTRILDGNTFDSLFYDRRAAIAVFLLLLVHLFVYAYVTFAARYGRRRCLADNFQA